MEVVQAVQEIPKLSDEVYGQFYFCISRLKWINYCVAPAKQSEYVSVTIDSTEFYEVVAHSLRRGCESIKVVWFDADFRKNDVIYKSFELYDVGGEMQFIKPARWER